MAKDKTSKTKRRIIETAISLYNRERYVTVTTAQLARELDMAEGNLWYHFNDKKALLEAIVECFSADISDRLDMRPVAGASLDSYTDYLRKMAGEMTSYLFLYRDQLDYSSFAGSFLEQIPAYYARTHDQYSSYFHQMREEQHLTIDPAHISDLAHNVILVLRYYVDYIQEASLPFDGGANPIKLSLAQHLTLLRPYLSPQADSKLVSALNLEPLI